MKISSTVRKGEFGKVPRIRQLAGFLPYAEIELSVLSRLALNQRIPNPTQLNRVIWFFEADRNKKRASVHWQFTTTDARIKLKRLYPVVQPEPSPAIVGLKHSTAKLRPTEAALRARCRARKRTRGRPERCHQ